MRRAATGIAAAVLLAGPTVLAFFTGGFFDEPRLWAGALAWALVLGAAAFADRPVPRGWPAWAALGGLAALTAWTAVSIAWAPLAGAAVNDVQRLALYLGGLVAATALLRPRGTARWVEPALCTGTLIVIGYGISERLLPGLITFTHSRSAFGRLEQPLTYWNAMGALAALGLVLAARLAGDRSRPDVLRAAAAGASVVLGLGVYLSFSRGAIAAVVVGLAVVVLLAPDRSQRRAVALCLGAPVVASIVASALGGVRALGGGLDTREAQGAAMLAVLAALVLGAAAATIRWCRRERSGALSTASIRAPRLEPVVIAVGAVLVVGLVLAAASAERKNVVGTPAAGATARRLGSFESNRYAYWKVALRSFADDPLKGSGSGSFRIVWLRERPFRDPAQDAHSLYIETAGELGLPGLAALFALFLGAAAAARRAYRREPVLTAGWIAALCVWAIHAGIDWDWEMPAVTLVAIILTGALLARADVPSEGPSAGARPADDSYGDRRRDGTGASVEATARPAG